MFESWRRTVLEEEPPAPVRAAMPVTDPMLREEHDPDPLVEEMVQRLRDGLRDLMALDEWGRPIAWRNVVRLAVGPLAGRLRDAEQSAELATAMFPEPVELLEPRPVATPAVVEVVVPQQVAVPAVAEAVVPPAVAQAVVPQAPAGEGVTATSLFLVSGDQRPVPVRPLGPGELLRSGSPYDATAAEYDRFLTSLYGEGEQVRADEDRRP